MSEINRITKLVPSSSISNLIPPTKERGLGIIFFSSFVTSTNRREITRISGCNFEETLGLNGLMLFIINDSVLTLTLSVHYSWSTYDVFLVD